MNTQNVCCSLTIESHRGVVASEKFWRPGAKISVGFLDGTIEQWERTMRIAKAWEHCGNVHFYEEAPERATVRIAYSGVGNWSFVGTDALKIKAGATMNLALYEHYEEKEWQRVVLHEFGHVLGLEHEHKHSNFTFQNEGEANAYLQRLGWKEIDIYNNIYNKHGLSDLGELDVDSIMLYDFGSSVANYKISTSDCKNIREIYGQPKKRNLT